MDDNTEARLKALMNLLMQEISKSHRIVGDYTPHYKLEELAEITRAIADYEVAINRILCKEEMETFAA